MNWRAKINDFVDLKQKIRWTYKVALDKKNPENYLIEYISQPINSSLFEKTFSKIVSKGGWGINYNDIKLNKEIEILKDGLKDKEKEVMSIFPRVNLKKWNILSGSLDRLVVIKTKEGLIIKGFVKGLRKC
jgi:hypothetical protein